MAASKLYPTLSKFYNENYEGFSNDLDNNRLRVQEDSLNRNDIEPVSKKNLNIRNSDKKSQIDQHANATSNIYPNLSENTVRSLISDEGSQEHDKNTNKQAIPSAPPVELLDEEFIHFLENAIKDQRLCPSLDETPEADYTILIEDSWVDDLQPDYDISMEDAGVDFLNNLNKEDLKICDEKLHRLKTKAEQESTQLNISSEEKRSNALRHKDFSRGRKVDQRIGGNETPAAAQRTERAHGNVDLSSVTENGLPDVVSNTNDRPTPGSPEYKAWMTWRKQVNRQLATVILLRHGNHVKFHQSDLSRKHLNRRSIDFVSNVVKPSNKTSLGGKPFVMYGIPRACLSGSHAH